MKNLRVLTLIFVGILSLFVSNGGAELAPVVGINTFGGAERGGGTGITSPAGGVGGAEVFGLYPFSKTLGIQGSFLNQGGRGGYRLGVSAGPVFDYGSGKVGLFTDYIHQHQGSNNYVYLRGQWAHYFQNWDLVFGYSQPVNSVQHITTTAYDVTRTTTVDTCLADGDDTFTETTVQPRRVKTAAPAINELKATVRIYPTNRTELSLGFLVNSFAGPDRNKTGTGFGGTFGASIQLLDWLIFRPIQGQMDTRERYRITSGLEFTWTPAKQEKRERLLGEGKDTSFALASGALGSVTSSIGNNT